MEYKIDSGIVRGLDYYTKTVFEFISEKDGLTVLAGGRYDGLVKELGGTDTPAVGFAAGEERLLSLISEDDELKDFNTDLYIVAMGEKETIKALTLAEKLRENIAVETDICQRSFNAQLKYANKIGVDNLLVIGENELKTNTAKIKNMETGKEYNVELDVDSIYEKIIELF